MGKVIDFIFRQPEATYTRETPGFVDIGEDGRCLAAIQGGAAYARELILYFHGNDEDIAESIKAMESFIPPRTAIVGVAYPGYGLSEGEQSEENCYAAARRLYDWARSELGYGEEEILIVGFSMGTAIATKLATEAKARALILQAPFTRARDTIAIWYGKEKLNEFVADDDPYPTIERIVAVKCPVTVIHGSADEVVPIALGREVYERVTDKRGFYPVDGAGHCDLLMKLGAERYREILEAL